jgi:serine/threonine-protein kinase
LPVRDCPKCNARFSGELTACPIDGTELVVPGDPLIGRIVAGRYLVEELIGTGGMGTVYRAHHQFIDRDVALKFLEPSLTRNERLRKRFLGEARAANQINHEHIIDINDFGETEDGLVYMVMEYLDGEPLDEEIERGPLELRRALRIALQVAMGLGRAHELGVVHRDIKPANIYLTRRNSDGDFVKILDFGVARIETDARITGKNMIVGTPEYIAPEQIRSTGVVPSSDLYSLGCVLFEMLTGVLPFEGKTTVLLVKHINDPPPAPSSKHPTLPPAVDALVLRLLQKKPEDRYRDAYHLAEELRGLIDMLPRAEGAMPERPSVRSAAIKVDNEEEGWNRTAKLYAQLVREAHPSGEVPSWLPDSIQRIEQIVTDIGGLRHDLRSAAEKATEREQEVRRPREQIGHALDQLAQDESRIARQCEEIESQIAPAEAGLDAAIHALLARGATELPRMQVGYVLTTPDVAMMKDLARWGGELELARMRVADLRSRLDRKRAEGRDVRYQMAQLKQKLDTLNAASTLDKEVWTEEVNRLSATIHARLEAIPPVAERISRHLSQYPALRERLSQRPEPRQTDDTIELAN